MMRRRGESRKAPRPLLQDARELRRLARVLVMQRVVEIVVFAGRDELAEHRLAIRREGELLDEADLGIVGAQERREGEEGEQGEGESGGHRKGAAGGVLCRRSGDATS